MSVKDVIKKSFLEGFNSTTPSLKIMLLCLVAALLLGIYIYVVYKLSCRNSFYSSDFSLSLIMTTVITAAIILTIQNSVIVSLGMVGALSIVRFRTAVKSSMDLVFMFWAISIGIITGTSMLGLAILVSVILSVLIVGFRVIPQPKSDMFFVSVDAEDEKSLEGIFSCVKSFDRNYHMQSQNLSAGRLSVTVKLHTTEPDEVLVSLYKCEGVKNVSVIAHGDNTNL